MDTIRIDDCVYYYGILRVQSKTLSFFKIEPRVEFVSLTPHKMNVRLYSHAFFFHRELQKRMNDEQKKQHKKLPWRKNSVRLNCVFIGYI